LDANENWFRTKSTTSISLNRAFYPKLTHPLRINEDSRHNSSSCRFARSTEAREDFSGARFRGVKINGNSKPGT